jgi:hypothetical protein
LAGILAGIMVEGASRWGFVAVFKPYYIEKQKKKKD